MPTPASSPGSETDRHSQKAEQMKAPVIVNGGPRDRHAHSFLGTTPGWETLLWSQPRGSFVVYLERVLCGQLCSASFVAYNCLWCVCVCLCIDEYVCVPECVCMHEGVGVHECVCVSLGFFFF